jgi:hypothetical protein
LSGTFRSRINQAIKRQAPARRLNKSRPEAPERDRLLYVRCMV